MGELVEDFENCVNSRVRLDMLFAQAEYIFFNLLVCCFWFLHSPPRSDKKMVVELAWRSGSVMDCHATVGTV